MFYVVFVDHKGKRGVVLRSFESKDSAYKNMAAWRTKNNWKSCEIADAIMLDCLA